MTDKFYVRAENVEAGPNRFYLIFDQIAAANAEDCLTAEQIIEAHEIEQVIRMVQDSSGEERPLFMTST